MAHPPPEAADAPPHLSERVALFVRDATEESRRLASLVEAALAGRGLVATSIVSAHDAADWKADAAKALASGAPYAVRVSVTTRRARREDIHHPVDSSRPASGIVIGPAAEPVPADFPELREPVGREPIDVGPTAHQEDLRLDVMASVRPIATGRVAGRWLLSEGSLRLLSPAPIDHDGWEAIYRALAERIADHVARTIWQFARSAASR